MIIGNPPYGTGANMAIKFVNKSGDLADEVRMVLPLSFRRVAVQNKIRLDFHCVEDIKLPDDTFPRSIRAVRQRWVKGDTIREKVETRTTHPDFEFLKYNDRDKANVFIGGAGAGPAGKVKTEDFLHYAKGHHFIRCSKEIQDRLVEIGPELRHHSRQACCLPGLGKADLITIYSNRYD